MLFMLIMICGLSSMTVIDCNGECVWVTQWSKIYLGRQRGYCRKITDILEGKLGEESEEEVDKDQAKLGSKAAVEVGPLKESEQCYELLTDSKEDCV
jgi:hypothetical protein